MIIRGWEIDGFGAFRDQRSPDLGDGLSVLHGPNEAGKSTLLAFIRGVLFGFPDKRSKGKQPLYEPPGGGAFGGSVIVEHDGRAYRIHRRAGSRNNRPAITDAHGQSVPEGELPQILGGADETLFKNVFGFSLSELQEGESLTDEGVRDRIFSNAVAGAGRDARKAAEELEGQAKALYSPNARQKRNRAAQLLDEIKQVDQQLAEARAAVRDYPNKLEAERAAAEEKARLDHDIAHWRTRRQELDALLRLWEPWCARARALETLEQLTGRSLPRVEPVRGDAALDAQQRQVDALRESLGLQRQRLLDAGEQANQLQAEDARIAHTLETLGPAWTEQRVEAFSLPIPAREEVRAWQRALDGAETDVAKAEEQRAEAERRRRESAERHEKLARDLENVSDPPPKLETLQQRQGDLEDLRAKAAELARLRDTEGYARTAAQAAEARLDELRAGQPGRAATLGAIGAAALAVAAALGAALLGDLAAAGALAVLAVVLAGAFAGLRRRARKNAAEIERARDDRDTKRETPTSRRRGCARSSRRLPRPPARSASKTCRARATWPVRPPTLAISWRAGAGSTARSRRWRSSVRMSRSASRRSRIGCRRWRPPRPGASARRKIGRPGSATGTFRTKSAQKACSISPSNCARRRKPCSRNARWNASWTSCARRSPAGRTAPGRSCARAAAATGMAAPRGAEATGEALIEAFNAAAQAIQSEQAAYQQIREVETALLREAGNDEARAAELRQTLAGGDAQAWADERAKLDEYLEAQQSARDEALKREQEATRDRQAVETSDRIAELETRRNQLAGEVGRRYRQWQVYACAQALIEETLERFERERQPAVFARASERLARFSHGRYTQIRQAEAGQDFRVIDADDRAVQPIDLSRGTREQLYLAVRLGLIEEFAQRGTSLPLVLDEILVNFDPDRMAAVAGELARFAENHQVLLFTCHPEIAQRVQANAPGAASIPMAELAAG